jgi:hypothetical protein
MKTKIAAVLMAGLAGILQGPGIMAQGEEKGSGNVVIQTRDVPVFHGIEAGGVFKIFITPSNIQKVEIETDDNLQDNIRIGVDDGILELSSNRIRNFTKLNVYIQVMELTSLKASGACEVKTEAAITSSPLEVKASGASEVTMEMNVKELDTEVSGAAEVKLSGYAAHHDAQVSGAANLKASGLKTEVAEVEISGAGNANLDVTEEVKGEVTGAGSLNLASTPKIKNVSKSGIAGIKLHDNETDWSLHVNDEGVEDSTKIKLGKFSIGVFEDQDSTRITIGNKTLTIDDNGNIELSNGRNIRKRHFNGHWAGFDLGFNGYLTPDFDMNFPSSYEYLDLNMGKSLACNINFFEENFNLVRDYFGIVTGFGLECHNYRFDRNTTLMPDSSSIIGYLNRGINVKKTKLVVNYLTMPLMFEVQTKGNQHKHRFHFGAGVVLGVRIASHTKIVFEEQNKEFYWTKYDAGTGEYTDVAMVKSPDNEIAKDHDDFHLNPFKVDATVRLGYSWVNLFGTYSLTTMFKNDKGPELYPFSIGIALSDW